MLIALFTFLRRIERWLHQHVFKVGWLSTHDYQTTTILYYTFFLPGVVLHEVVYWLAAGVFNVRAERSIKWPEKQEIGELQLNFVQLASNTGIYRKAIISIAPLIAGILAIWYIVAQIYDVPSFLNTIQSGELADFTRGLSDLTAAPNFWLWLYIIFTIGNTMFPQIPQDLQGWRTIALGGLGVSVALLLIGLGGEIFEFLSGSLENLLTILLTTIVMLILIDVFMVLLLGTIEWAIETTTGHSATFRGGKMITMTREEVLAEQARERRQKQLNLRPEPNENERVAVQSVYDLPFPIPGAPGEIAVSKPATMVNAQDNDETPAFDEPPVDLADRVSFPAIDPPITKPDDETENSAQPPGPPDDTPAKPKPPLNLPPDRS